MTGDCGNLDNLVPWGHFPAPAAWETEAVGGSCYDDGDGRLCDYGSADVSCQAAFSGAPSQGYLGTAFIVAFADLDDNGKLDLPSFDPETGEYRADGDLIVGTAPNHMLVYTRDLDEGGRSVVGPLFVDGTSLPPGFALAEGVCRADAWNVLQLAQDTSVVVTDSQAAESGCLGIY
jgi:hypothetical protein